MSTTPGWYADPAPGSAPGSLRWWDGSRWTEQTQSPQPAQQQSQQASPQAPQASSQQQWPVQLTKPAGGSPAPYQGGGAPQVPLGPPEPPVPLTHTPDGMTLASPGKRLGAALLDGLFVTVVSLVFVVLFMVVVFGGGALSGAFDPASSDEPPPEFIVLVLVGYFALFLGSALFGVWYYVVRVRKVGATFGKQVLGLRVRTFHTDGQLTWGQVWGRYGIPAVINGIVGVTYFVDSLWLLWDKHRQTLHDKAVGTVVVDTSLPRVPADHPGVQYARAYPAARGWVADGPNPQTPADYPR
jgi:uncharacterized RDD family membrane protein YckC